MTAALDGLALAILLAALAAPVPARIALRSVLRGCGGLVKPDRAGAMARLLHRSIVVAAAVTAGMLAARGEAGAGCEIVLAVLCLGLLATDARWYWLPLPWTLALLSSGLVMALADGMFVDGLTAAAAVAAALELLRAAFRRLRGVEAMGSGDVILGAGMAAHIGLAQTGALFTVAALAALLHCAASGGMSSGRRVPFGAWLCLVFLPVLFGLSYC